METRFLRVRARRPLGPGAAVVPKSASGIAALHTRARCCSPRSEARWCDDRPGGAMTGLPRRSPRGLGRTRVGGFVRASFLPRLTGWRRRRSAYCKFVFFDRRQSVQTAAARRLRTGCITQTSPRHDLCDRSRGNSSRTSRAASDHSFEAEQPIQSVPLVGLGIQAWSDRVRTPSRSVEFY